MNQYPQTSHRHFDSDIDRIFFTDGVKLATEYLEKGISVDQLLAMSEAIYLSMDQLIDAFVQRCHREGKKVECKKGCYVCCCQTVLILPYEALYLCRFLKENVNDRVRAAILIRAKEKDAITRKMKVREFLHHKSPCPLLDKGSCLAYEARPMACRTYLSSRADSCIEEYHNPKNPEIFPNLYAFTIRAGRMINEGICNYLYEKGIPAAEWQIESVIKTAFEKKEAFSEWLAGNNVFQKRDYTPEELAYLDNFGFKEYPGG